MHFFFVEPFGSDVLNFMLTTFQCFFKKQQMFIQQMFIQFLLREEVKVHLAELLLKRSKIRLDTVFFGGGAGVSSLPGTQTQAVTLRARNPSHYTAREPPIQALLIIICILGNTLIPLTPILCDRFPNLIRVISVALQIK